MTKRKLKFKTEGGLRKLPDFYAHTDTGTRATGTCWHNPAALMEALEAAPAREIRILDKWEGTFSRASEECGDVFEENAFNSLLHAAGGHTPALRAGELGGGLKRLVATVTVIGESQREAPHHTPRTPVPGSPRLSQMALYAQPPAPQADWFSRP